VSKRHQASRRKAYGRRQHELHERRERQLHAESFDAEFADLGPLGMPDRFGFLDPRTPRLRYVLGD
jgi:hypothetical protein